jgi:hypothetical protein
MTSTPPILLLAGLLAGCVQASAAVVTLSSQAPSSNLIRYNALTAATPANINSYWRGPGGTDVKKNIGQGFSLVGETTDYSLQAVTFNIFGFSAPVQGLSFNISIYQTSAVATVPTLGNLIASENGTMASNLVVDDFIRFSLDNAVTLEKGYFYNVVFSFAEMTSTNSTVQSLSFKTVGSGVSITSGGRRWIDTDGVYSASASNGFVFYAEGMAIPEPSTLLLAGAGISLVALRKRIHR